MHYQGSLKSINLLFGSACNQKCGYCLQQDDEPKNNKKADVDDFLTKFTEFVHSNNITVSSVHYWGGEPMLYWDRIQKVYLGLASLFDARMHRITTNGTIVTDEYVDFCNEHPDIFTVVSYHDGNITKEQWRRLARLKNFSIENLIHHYQLDPRVRKDFWLELCDVAGREIPIGFDAIKANNGCAPEYWLTLDDLQTYFTNIVEIYDEANRGDVYASKVIAHFLFNYKRDLIAKTGNQGSPCVNPKILSIDLFGNTYKCHHDNSPNNVTGNIFKKVIPIVEARHNELRYFDSPICRMCEAYRSCGGGCYTSNTHEVECKFYKARHYLAKYFLSRLKE